MLIKALTLATATALLTACSFHAVPNSSPIAGNQLERSANSVKLYVSNEKDNSVAVFIAGGPFLRKATDQIGLPLSLATNASGIVFIANYGPQRSATNVAVYSPGARKLLYTITDHVAKPKHVVVDRTGALYVSMSRWVQVYSHATTSKTYRIYPGGGPIAVDGSENLYVAENGAVAVYAAHTKHKPRKIEVTGDITTLAVDSSGELFVGLTNTSDFPCHSAVDVYDGSTGSFLREITQDICGPSDVVFDGQQNAYVANVIAEGSYSRSVAVFAAGTTSVLRLITNGVTDPVSIALAPDGTLFVANNLQSTVSVYGPGQSTPEKVLSKQISGPSSVVVGPSSGRMPERTR